MLWGFPHCYPVKFVRPRLPTIHPPTRQVYQSPKCGIWADTAVRKWESTKCWINILFKHTENVVVTHLFCDDDTKCLLSQFFFKHTAVRMKLRPNSLVTWQLVQWRPYDVAVTYPWTKVLLHVWSIGTCMLEAIAGYTIMVTVDNCLSWPYSITCNCFEHTRSDASDM